MSCLVVANALESGDDLDLDQTAGRKGGNLESAARGERSLELGGVDLVHGSEVGDVGQPQAAAQHLGQADTERLLLEHTAPALVEMASFFSPAFTLLFWRSHSDRKSVV